MKHTTQAFLVSVVVLLSACTTTSVPPKGLDTTKQLQIDERLLTKPRRFEHVTTRQISEFELLAEYAAVASAYGVCYGNLEGLIRLLESSNLVLKVPAVPTFMADPSSSNNVPTK